MSITIAALVLAGIQPTQARQFAEPLSTACGVFEIDTPARIAAFVAQCAHESVQFTRLEENLRYSRPERLRDVFPSRVHGLDDAARLVAAGPKAIANRVYAGKLGNGDEASGDGWRYRGRGLIQLTGRANYSDAATECGEPYLDEPDLLLEPGHACLTAAWFWHTRKCNLLADSAQWDAITRAINGPAMLAADDRLTMTERALGAFA